MEMSTFQIMLTREDLYGISECALPRCIALEKMHLQLRQGHATCAEALVECAIMVSLSVASSWICVALSNSFSTLCF